MPDALAPHDVQHLTDRCAGLRDEALSHRAALRQLSREASWPGADVYAVAAALVAWIEDAQLNTATLRLIRQTARAAGEGRLARLASAPLRQDLAQAGALLVRLRAEHRLRGLGRPSVGRPSVRLPSGVVLGAMR